MAKRKDDPAEPMPSSDVPGPGSDGERPPDAPMPPDLSAFGAFYRPTGKGLATRYGQPSEPIGLLYDEKTGQPLRDAEGHPQIDTRIVIALSHEEAQRYQREYARQMREGALERVDARAYLAFLGFAR